MAGVAEPSEYLCALNIARIFRETRWWLAAVMADFVQHHSSAAGGEEVLGHAEQRAVTAHTFRLLWDAMQVRAVPTQGWQLWLTLAACWCIATKCLLDVDHDTWDCVQLASRSLPDAHREANPRRQLHAWELGLLADLQWRVSPTRRAVVHPARPAVPPWVDIELSCV